MYVHTICLQTNKFGVSSKFIGSALNNSKVFALFWLAEESRFGSMGSLLFDCYTNC